MHIVYVFKDQECSVCVLFVHSTVFFIPFVSHDKVFWSSCLLGKRVSKKNALRLGGPVL